jgi:hypothetical protein
LNNLRLSEILSSLSLAKDLANGNPLETSIRSAYLASFLGCTSFASDESNFLGDDIESLPTLNPYIHLPKPVFSITKK